MGRQSGRLLRWFLACVIVLGSLALWIALPVAWMTATGALVSDAGAQFVIVIFGCPVSMAFTGLVLAVLEDRRQALSPAEEPRALLEPMLVASGVIAFVGFVLWWFLIADAPNPSGPLQPI
jgi:hypothetical protein